MRWYFYLILGVSGLAMALAVSHFQPSPGYMDADYYYAGGKQLALGHGFSEMILWNYLDNPTGLPHPSHAYWMPLASIVAAAGMALTGFSGFSTARIGFLLLAACIPPLTALLSYKLTSRSGLALAAGFFAVFSGYYVPYFSVTDTFAIYMILGAIFFLLVGFGMEPFSDKRRFLIAILLGLVAGLAHLSRADGFIWLFMAILAVIFFPKQSTKSRFGSLALAVVGYLLVMSPWFFRNSVAFGTPLTPGGNHALWLATYDDTFAYPASRLTFNSWLASGWRSILEGRLEALKWNLQTAWAVQGVIFLLPFILVGLWNYRHDLRIWVGVIAWSMTFLAMTLIFPFAGARGSFLHSGAALQPLWWALTPVGIEQVIMWEGTKRKWKTQEASQVFLFGFIGISILLSGMIFYGRVYSKPGWGAEAISYHNIDNFISKYSLSPNDVVLVGNPPGYYTVSGRPAISVPNENLEKVVDVAHKYNGKFLVLEKNSVPAPLQSVYEHPVSLSSIQYLGEVDGARIFAIP